MNRKHRREIKKDPILTHEYITDIKKRYFLIGAEEMFFTIMKSIKETKGIGPKTLERIFEELGKVHPRQNREVHKHDVLEKENEQDRKVRNVQV